MAKMSYKIPTSLNKSHLDTEIALKNQDGIGLKPVSLKVIFFYVISIFVFFWFVSATFMDSLNLFLKIIFGIVWLLMTGLLAKYTPTKEMQLTLVTSYLNYMPKRNRVIYTRSTSNANDFYNLLGIESIDDEGLVKYIDGSVAYFYRVVGSGSVLLFDADRDSILDRVDAFYMKFPIETEIITMTTKESQKIYRQKQALKERYDNLMYDDPDLRGLLEEQFEVLKNHIGQEFKSIHQYWILKSGNVETLNIAQNHLRGEVESSAKMIRLCTPLYRDDILECLGSIYKGRE